MKQILFYFSLLQTSFVVFGQVNVQWESRLDYSSQSDFTRGIVIDAAGNSYVTGTAFNGNNFDIVTVKYDPSGAELWTNTYNGAFNGWDDATGIVLDGNNDVIIGGFHQTGATDYDIMALKINGLTGAQVWLYTYAGTTRFDLCNAVGIDGNNNVILGGAREATAADQDFVTISVSSTGSQNWASTFIPSGRDVINALAIDAANNVYVTGESFDATNNLDFYTIKYNSSGVQQWANRYDGAGSIDIPKAISVDNVGNVYIVGTSYRNVSIEEDIMLLKLNSLGTPQWDAVYGGSSEDFDAPSDVTTDPLGNIYVAGKVKNLGNGEDFLIARYRQNGTLHWDYTYQSATNGYDEAKKVYVNSNFEIFASGYSNITGNNDDYLTIKLDTIGTELWQTRFNGPASTSDQMVDFRVDPVGNIFVTGSSVGSGTNRDFSTIKYCQLQTTATSNDLEICIGQSVQLGATGGFNFQWSLVSGDPITASNFSCTSCANPVATPSVTSTYLVTSENAAGCVDSDSITIVINPLPGPVISTNGPTEFCEGGSVTLTADFATSYNWNNGATTQAINTDTSGVFILTVTDAMGCQNSTSVEVMVNPLPAVSAGPDRFRCPGIGLTLNGNGADSLAWFRIPTPSNAIANGTSITPSNTGSYVLVGINNNGCVNRDTMQLTIFPFPSQVELSQGMSGNLFINLNDGTTDWFLDGNSLNHTGTSFFYDSLPFCNGVYSVVYTDENGCETTDEIIITDACQDTIDTTINVAQFYKESFVVFPNPTVDKVTIQFESIQKRTILVNDSQGKLILHLEGLDDQYFIDLSHLAKGTYTLAILSDGTVTRSNVIKQ